MKLRIGNNIATMRKKKGMTQEQLATALGVSTPAVSKWETNTTYPDITLLCPLARALGTNIDKLLQFEEALSEKEIATHIDRIAMQAQEQGLHEAEQSLSELLRTYPSCMVLKYEAAMLLQGFMLMSPDLDNVKKEEYRTWRKELLNEARHSAEPSLAQPATYLLASFAVDENNLDEAEELLNTMPENVMETSGLWSRLWIKRGEVERARGAIQSDLFNLIQNAGKCLAQLTNENLEPDIEKALQICEIHRAIAGIVNLKHLFSESLFVDVYLRAGEKDKALESISHWAEKACKSEKLSHNILFSTITESLHDQQQSVRETCQLLLHGLLTDDKYTSIREEKGFQEVVKVLENISI